MDFQEVYSISCNDFKSFKKGQNVLQKLKDIFQLLMRTFPKPDLFYVFVSKSEKAFFGEVLVYSVAMEKVLISRRSKIFFL